MSEFNTPVPAPHEIRESESGSHEGHHAVTRPTLGLILGALGVVYGDIGTSPLYAMRECFFGEFAVSPNPENVLGVLSLILWALIFVVTLNYVFFVLRADNKGEGGILALLALLHPRAGNYSSITKHALLFTALFGASLLYGDGVITPAISVLSAVEGLQIVTPVFEPFVVPITIAILVALFWGQSGGTEKIGAIFGPIILLWFLTIAVLGIMAIPSATLVFAALNPLLGLNWITSHGWDGFRVLSGVFLVCTGAEALYADMGHFGRPAIKRGWLIVVLPALLLNYFGQGALLLSSEPGTISNPFFQLAPSWAVLPLVLLSTVATVIASQALISGAYSLTMQAVQLGYLPRLRILHTSATQRGQIYVPFINWSLLIVTIILVLQFGSSSKLAAAYGAAVSLTMVMTTFLMFFAARNKFGMRPVTALCCVIPFTVINLNFLASNSIKFFEGGWFPIVLGGFVFTIMSTWWRGREVLAATVAKGSVPLNQFIDRIEREAVAKVPGTAIYMSRNTSVAPMALVHNFRHNHIVHETVLFLQVQIEEQPTIEEQSRIEVERLQQGFYRIGLRYGFMEEPNVTAALIQCRAMGAVFDLNRVTFFLGRELVLPTARPGMALWRERLFAFITSVAARATAYFKIPTQQVVEIGDQVEI